MRTSAILLLLTLSCAYYNTFYNAKKYYSEAQKVQAGKDAKLDKCIEKCARVIEYHPRSRWVDDAIFLMGKCFYEKRDYSRAGRKFGELLEYFPESPFVEEASLYLGRSYLAEGEYLSAIDIFSRLKETRWDCQASFHIAEVLYVTEDYKAAASAYQDLLRSCPKTEFREEALENLAASLLRMEEYSTAIELYNSLLSGHLTEEERLEISLRIGDAYLNMGEPERALEVLAKVEGEVEEDESRARIRLKLSEGYRDLDRLDEAAQLAPKSPTSARAYYQQALVYEEDLRDFDKAREGYQKAVDELKSSEISEMARLRVNTFDKLTDLKAKLEGEEPENPAEVQFLIAELLLIELENPDLALDEYGKVLTEFEDGVYTPKAIYAIAWIHHRLKEDRQTSETYLNRLIEDYPGTEYADMARRMLPDDHEEE